MADHAGQQNSGAGPEAASGGRDSSGRFTKGNRGGPGNPYSRYTAAMRKSFADEATAEDLRKIARAMIEKAQGGDVGAARLVCGYTMGRPLEGTHPDKVDADEWQNWKDNNVPVAESQAVLVGLSADMACKMAGGVVPTLAQARADTIVAAIAAPPAPHEDDEEDDDDEEVEEWYRQQEQAAADEQAAPKTDEEIVAELPERQRRALEEVFRAVGRPGAATMSDATDSKRPAEQRRAANPDAGKDELPGQQRQTEAPARGAPHADERLS
jgi:hypothetical protein